MKYSVEHPTKGFNSNKFSRVPVVAADSVSVPEIYFTF